MEPAERIAELEAELAQARELINAARNANPQQNANQPEVVNLVNLADPLRQDNRVEVCRVPKVPPFILKDPALWFLQLESTFRTAGVRAQTTMGDYAFAALNFEAVACCRDIIEIQDRTNLYDRLKDRITATYSASAESRLRRLLKGDIGTDGKPSLILNQLNGLNDGKCSESVIRSVFLEQLTPHCRQILAISDVTEVRKLAEMADQIYDVSDPNGHRAFAVSREVKRDSRRPDTMDPMEQLASAVAKLSAKVDRLEQRQSRTRSQSRPNPQSRSGSPSGERPKMCWAHRKFGKEAYEQSCRKPCAWDKGPTGG